MSIFASQLWSPISGGITAPLGFKASGVRAGLKKSSLPDLALVLAPTGAVCAGNFTQSAVRASCIDLCIERLKKNLGHIRAVVINSGQANAFTGDRGLKDSLQVTKRLADLMHLQSEEVLICSTGVIGEPIPIENLLGGLNSLVNDLSTSGGKAAASAILTTDLVEKQIAIEAVLGGRRVRIGGMAKGSGMIHPNMATMLGFLSCDALIPQDLWSQMVTKAVDVSFNSITVDGDTSTNDACLAFAAGEPLDDKYFEALQDGLVQASQYLAQSIARDGEGANCLIEARVSGTDTSKEARLVAREICASSLVKTAIHGADPNWGRIIAVLGRSGVSFEIEDISLKLGPYSLIEFGKPLLFDRDVVSTYLKSKLNAEYLKDDSVIIHLSIGKGNGTAVAWGCDLSDQYIRINADYTT